MIELPFLPQNVHAGKPPGWNAQNARRRPCPVCSGDTPAPLVIRPDRFVVHKCKNCGMHYLADIPSPEELAKFYQGYGIHKNYGFGKAGLWDKISANLNNPFINILENTGGIRGVSICEIGCSGGFFLELLKYRGGNVFGVELDANAAKVLEEKKIPHSESIPEGRRYDVFCLFQVLEHLSRPGDMLETIAGAMEKDGRLLISIPNAGEIAKAGLTWIGFRVDLEHINYFDLASLSNLLSRHGLLLEQFWEHAQPCIPRSGPVKSQPSSLTINWRRITGLIYPKPISSQGSFVATILARKG